MVPNDRRINSKEILYEDENWRVVYQYLHDFFCIGHKCGREWLYHTIDYIEIHKGRVWYGCRCDTPQHLINLGKLAGI